MRFFLISFVLALGACDSCKDGGAPATADGSAGSAPTTIPDAAPLNALPIPPASVAAMVNPQNLPAYAGPTGVIEGTITVVGDPPLPKPSDFNRHKCPDAEKTYGVDFREGPPQTPGGPRPLADAIVGATGYSGFYVPVKDEAKELTIEGCAFTQRTVAMTFGQRLEVKNLTKDFWTPVIEPAPNLVLMMAAPGGDPVKIYPKKPGRYVLGDRDRKYVYADLYAFLYPTHAVSKLDGTYRIDGVPVGKLKVSARHPRIDDEVSIELDVKANVVHKVDLKLSHRAPDGGAPKDAGPDADPNYPRLR